MIERYDSCEICSSNDWCIAYSGSIRDGRFGSLHGPTIVASCNGCGAQRLLEGSCIDESQYESKAYRKRLREDPDTEGFFKEHDVLQLERLNMFAPYQLRNKVVADIGCAAGAFLDHVSGLASKIIAVEPAKHYHDSLQRRGYCVSPYANNVPAELHNTVDFAFSFSVIEHVLDPKQYLIDIRQLLHEKSRLIISTPNRNDILMSLLPDQYPSFFYRTVHRWYFDKESFTKCSTQAGYRVIDTLYLHRFNLSNAMTWMRDKKPQGRNTIDVLQSHTLNNVWRNELEAAGTADYMYFVLELDGE